MSAYSAGATAIAPEQQRRRRLRRALADGRHKLVCRLRLGVRNGRGAETRVAPGHRAHDNRRPHDIVRKRELRENSSQLGDRGLAHASSKFREFGLGETCRRR